MRAVCPNCQSVYNAPDTASGKRTTCKVCSTKFVIPPAAIEPVPAPIPPSPPPAPVPQPAAPLVGCPHCHRPFVSPVHPGGMAICPNCGGSVITPAMMPHPGAYYPPPQPQVIYVEEPRRGRDEERTTVVVRNEVRQTTVVKRGDSLSTCLGYVLLLFLAPVAIFVILMCLGAPAR